MWVTNILKILCLDIIPSIGDMGFDLLNGIDMLGVNVTIANTTITDDNYRVDTIWGTVAILLIFAPGFPLAISILLEYFKNPWAWLIAMLFATCYPFGMLFLQLIALCCGSCYEDIAKWLVLAVSYEAFFESNPQMVLQFFAIQNGYEITAIQFITIFFSFVLAAKTAIIYDITMYTEADFDDFEGFVKVVKYVAYVLPTYMTAIIFRIGSLSIITAYLRYWSLFPITMRAVFYGILGRCVGYAILELPIAAFSNLGSMTRGGLINDDTEVSSKFLFISTISTFVMETVFLVCILVVTITNPTFFDHWETELVYFDNTIAIISSIIGVGIINLLLLFYTQRKLKVSVITNEADC